MVLILLRQLLENDSFDFPIQDENKNSWNFTKNIF
jgi:hypothetical protein